jgi:hypothetical protein
MADLRKHEFGTSANGPSWTTRGPAEGTNRPLSGLSSRTCEEHAPRRVPPGGHPRTFRIVRVCVLLAKLERVRRFRLRRAAARRRSPAPDHHRREHGGPRESEPGGSEGSGCSVTRSSSRPSSARVGAAVPVHDFQIKCHLDVADLLSSGRDLWAG